MKNKIIILDDDERQLKWWVEALIKAGISSESIVATTDSSEAIKLASDLANVLAVFITDTVLDERNLSNDRYPRGYLVIPEVLRTNPTLPCLLISSSKHAKSDADKIGVRFWQKSRYPSELTVIVLELMNTN